MGGGAVPLTAGLADPESLEKHRNEMSTILEEQLKQQQAKIMAEVGFRKQMCEQRAAQSKSRYVASVDLELSKELSALEDVQRGNLKTAQDAFQVKKFDLEQTTLAKIMDYSRAKSAEEISKAREESDAMAAKMMEDLLQESQKGGLNSPADDGLSSGIGGVAGSAHIGGMGKPRGINVPTLKGVNIDNLQKLTTHMAKAQCDALKSTGQNAAISASTVAMQAMHMGTNVAVKK